MRGTGGGNIAPREIGAPICLGAAVGRRRYLARLRDLGQRKKVVSGAELEPRERRNFGTGPRVERNKGRKDSRDSFELELRLVRGEPSREGFRCVVPVIC